LSYSTAAQALFALALDSEPIIHIGAPDNPMRRIFRMAAEACQRIHQEQADLEAALLYVAELRALLDQASDLLEAHPLPIEGGTWDSHTLARKAHLLLEADPLTAGHALRDEVQATRLVARAATALVAARQEGSPERIPVCEEALQQAVAALKAAPNSAPIGPAPV
jgi:hypothetical protein